MIVLVTASQKCMVPLYILPGLYIDTGNTSTSQNHKEIRRNSPFLPAHRTSVWQLSVSSRPSPLGHLANPRWGVGIVHDLVLILSPTPQVTEQLDQSDQAVRPPSTGEVRRSETFLLVRFKVFRGIIILYLLFFSIDQIYQHLRQIIVAENLFYL